MIACRIDPRRPIFRDPSPISIGTGSSPDHERPTLVPTLRAGLALMPLRGALAVNPGANSCPASEGIARIMQQPVSDFLQAKVGS